MTRNEAIQALNRLITTTVGRYEIDCVCEDVIEYLEGLPDDEAQTGEWVTNPDGSVEIRY